MRQATSEACAISNKLTETNFVQVAKGGFMPLEAELLLEARTYPDRLGARDRHASKFWSHQCHDS